MTRLPHDRNKPFLTLTRQELYRRVWTTPVETLATTLHLSGRGLGKLCNRHSIPVPPRGYWARKAAGQKVIRTPLPQLADRAKGMIRFADKSHTRSEEQMSQQEPAELAFERDPVNRVVVNDDLPLTHARIVDAQRRLTRGRRDPQGLSIVRKGGLHIRTSRSQHERTLRLFQALLTAFETRCFEVVPTEECVCVRILDETLGFGFEEELTKVPHRVTFTEQKKIDRGYAWQVPTVDLVPSGKLTFAITNVGGMRRNWSEGSVRPEDRINVFIVGLVRAAINLKRQRAAHAESERERLEQERLRKEEEQRQVEQAFQWREEQGRVERLERLLEVRSRNQRLRTLLAELNAAAGVIDADSELGRWFAWAHEHVEHSDPLTRWRSRDGSVLTLYYHGHDHYRVPAEGFAEPRPIGYANEECKAGVELTARPPRIASYERALKLEILEDLVLPYEWAQESDWLWRMFRVPAALLNGVMGYGKAADVRSIGVNGSV